MDSKSIKVLLVEDNPEDVFLLERILQKDKGARFELETADSLSKALTQLEQKSEKRVKRKS